MDIIIPVKQDSCRLGGIMKRNWYPLRKHVNEKHIAEISKKDAKIIENECGDVVAQLGYDPLKG